MKQIGLTCTWQSPKSTKLSRNLLSKETNMPKNLDRQHFMHNKDKVIINLDELTYLKDLYIHYITFIFYKLPGMHQISKSF